MLEMTEWIALPLLLASVPALYEFGRGSVAALEIDDETIRWSTGRRRGQVPLHVLEGVRLDTRLDLSVRMSLMLRGGERVRLPYECVPPRERLEQELAARGIAVERHHFALLG